MTGRGAMENADQRWSKMVAIVGQYQAGLLRYATRLVRDPDAAQDVVQEVFVKLFQSWDGKRAASPKLRSWLYRVTHNQAVDHIRRQSRYRDAMSRHAAEPRVTVAPAPNEALAATERHRMVLDHVDRLTPVERQVLLLRLEEGLSYQEIADATARSVGNVGKVLHHAVRKMSKELQKTGVIQ
jgi:RNA polymerase sigma factor (sigma-70 family)